MLYFWDSLLSRIRWDSKFKYTYQGLFKAFVLELDRFKVSADGSYEYDSTIVLVCGVEMSAVTATPSNVRRNLLFFSSCDALAMSLQFCCNHWALSTIIKIFFHRKLKFLQVACT